MRATVLTPLILLGWSLQAIGQSPAPPSGEQPSREAQSPAASTPAASGSPVATGPGLKLVVALFRHGVRAPLKEIDPTKGPHAADPWPSPSQWGVTKWGDLTRHGASLVKALGYDYAQTYKKKFPTGFKTFLWADNVERTLATAQALRDGFKAGDVPATVQSRDRSPDPLFHPFEAHCGIPDPACLQTIAKQITANSQTWIDSKFGAQFRELYGVLACTDPTKCEPLKNVKDNTANACASPAPGCSDPIKWQGQFPYANTASETFLLEYANKMEVGWTRVLEPPPDGTAKLLRLMALHEFYFTQTQREGCVPMIQASNLLREITQTLNGENAPCRRIPIGYQFGALVGHDTNIAGVASLLKLSWQFADDAPVGTQGLPDNDPLPAGALLFELWTEADGTFVRIFYAAQGLREMRNFSGESCPAFRLPVRCDQYSVEPNGCKIPLTTFKQAVSGAIGKQFLSRCEGDQQVCGPISGSW
jgi:4-phytase/acid phosphatase